MDREVVTNNLEDSFRVTITSKGRDAVIPVIDSNQAGSRVGGGAGVAS